MPKRSWTRTLWKRLRSNQEQVAVERLHIKSGRHDLPRVVNGQCVIDEIIRAHIGAANGIGLDGRIAPTSKNNEELIRELQSELGTSVKVYHAGYATAFIRRASTA